MSGGVEPGDRRKFYGIKAYEAYADAADWKSLATGDRLPAWFYLSEDVQEAWILAAEAVHRAATEDAEADREWPKT